MLGSSNSSRHLVWHMHKYNPLLKQFPHKIPIKFPSSSTPFKQFSTTMGLILGKITVETPKFETLESTNEYEIRKYPASVVAQVTYDPSQMKGNKDGGFSILANYIGALGKPQNTKSESVAMTAPVVTQTQTKSEGDVGENPPSEAIAMTAPVITKDEEDGGVVCMQFILPAKYTKAEEAPKPLDERVVIKEEGEKKYGVVKFSGVANEGVVKEKVEGLKAALEKDGHRVIESKHLLARYNPPWTLPFLRTNEVLIPVE